MSKRRTDRLTKKDYEGISEWLKGYRLCPFDSLQACKIQCSDLFPNSMYSDGKHRCPCVCGSKEYVRRVARQILREKGERRMR